MIFGGKVFWRIAGRFYHKRSQRSLRLHRVFKEKSEKFFQRVKGAGVMGDTSEDIKFPMLIGGGARVAGEPRETIRTRLKKRQSLTLPQVADVAGDLTETIRKRLSRGSIDIEKVRGWKRFSEFEVVLVSMHARVKRHTGLSGLAGYIALRLELALKLELVGDVEGGLGFDESTYEAERFMVCWLGDDGEWGGVFLETPTEVRAAITGFVCQLPSVVVVNLGKMLRDTKQAIEDVQIRKDGLGE